MGWPPEPEAGTAVTVTVPSFIKWGRKREQLNR